MKTKVFLFVGFLFAFAIAQAQCEYFLFKPNKKITMGMYDKKDKPTGTVVYTVTNVKKSGSTSISTYNTEIFDKKGKQLTNALSSVKCDGGKLMMNMSANMTQNPMFKDVKAKADGAFLDYPSSLKVGQPLAAGSLDMDLDMSGVEMNIKINTYDREVVAKEKVTTPAGSWDAYKITSKSKTSTGILPPMVMENTEWFVPGFGIVKQESKHGTMELLSIE